MHSNFRYISRVIGYISVTSIIWKRIVFNLNAFYDTLEAVKISDSLVFHLELEFTMFYIFSL